MIVTLKGGIPEEHVTNNDAVAPGAKVTELVTVAVQPDGTEPVARVTSPESVPEAMTLIVEFPATAAAVVIEAGDDVSVSRAPTIT